MTETVSGAEAEVTTGTQSAGGESSALTQGFLGMGLTDAFDASAPGAVTVSQGLIILNAGTAAQDAMLLPGASGSSFLLSGDPSTTVSDGGYVFAPVTGATVGGASAGLPFLGGSDAVSVLGGNGETTMFGVSGGSSPELFAVDAPAAAPGGTGMPHVPGGTGSNLFVFIDSHAAAGLTPNLPGSTTAGTTEPVIPAGGLGSQGMITLSDGTIIQIQGLDRSLFG
ncbi:hypothetical protein [Acidisoma sp. 7E03]